MSPIIDLQRRLQEVGRIRIGEKAGNRPVKRETFRLTARDHGRLLAAQAVYPGVLRPWDNNGSPEWELLTETDSLRVDVLPGQTLSQWYEMWSGGGCQRRCDGERTLVPRNGACLCPADADERAELAKKGRACKATTRLNVVLPDVPGIGMWRLESHGYYAAVELAGISEFLDRATAAGVFLPARLRIDQRTSVKEGQTRRYPVPVLDVESSVREVQALAGGAQPRALDAPVRPELPAAPAADARPVSPTGTSEQAPAGASDPPRASAGAVISKAQVNLVRAKQREAGVTDAALMVLVREHADADALESIPKSRLDAVLAALKATKEG